MCKWCMNWRRKSFKSCEKCQEGVTCSVSFLEIYLLDGVGETDWNFATGFSLTPADANSAQFSTLLTQCYWVWFLSEEDSIFFKKEEVMYITEFSNIAVWFHFGAKSAKLSTGSIVTAQTTPWCANNVHMEHIYTQRCEPNIWTEC